MERLNIIGHIHTDFPEKFGIPRQSGLVKDLEGCIVFVPEYRNPDALRGLEGFEYLWILWGFEETARGGWSPLVRPPRLGGNKKMGVFATRSPFRPNPIGLSCVKLLGLEKTAEGTVVRVAGIDMRDGTPIYDIKPYLPYADSHPEARGGFAQEVAYEELSVQIPDKLLARIPEKKRQALLEVLRQDPRPHYQQSPERIYGMDFAGHQIRFRVEDDTLYVVELL